MMPAAVDAATSKPVRNADRAEVSTSGSFPMLARATKVLGAAFDLDRMFEFGLTRVLDGIGVLIEQRSEGASSAVRC